MSVRTAQPVAASSEPNVHVQILHVQDCPLVDGLRQRLQRCVAQSGAPVRIDEIEGPYPSPTLLIDGTDVTGRPTLAGPSCRLDLPTENEILAALTKANAERQTLRPPRPHP
jgi:hypothetical protein